MNRRTFLAAMSALATGLPSIAVAKPRTPVDLTDFTERPWHSRTQRYDLHTPFVQEDWHFATDGRIMIRADESAAGVIGPSEKRPNCVKLCEWLDGTEHDLWRPWPKQNWVTDSDSQFEINWCPVCEGRGSVVDAVECQLCDGYGDTITFHSDDPYDFTVAQCRACKGIGWTHTTPCDFCGGDAERTGMPTIQQVGHNIIQANYDKRIRKLGDVEYLTLPPIKGAKSDCIAFRGHRFVGLLMPIKRDYNPNDRIHPR